MGKIKQGIMGGFSGKVGPVIGSSWKGKAIIKARALSYNDRNSQAQQEVRARFALLNSFCSANVAFLNEGFRGLANGITALNAAFSVNYHSAITGTFPDYTIDYSKVTVASGSLSLPYAIAGTADSNTNTVNITWSDNSGIGNAKSDDGLMLLVYNATLDDSLAMFDLAKRSDRTASATIPTAWGTNEFYVWAAMRSADGTSISKSFYVGTFSIS